jgi:hypothetical protein
MRRNDQGATQQSPTFPAPDDAAAML